MLFGVRAVLDARQFRGRSAARLLLFASEVWWAFTTVWQIIGCANGMVPRDSSVQFGNVVFGGNFMIVLCQNSFAFWQLPRFFLAKAKMAGTDRGSVDTALQRGWCAAGWLFALVFGIPIFAMGWSVRAMDPWFLSSGHLDWFSAHALRMGSFVYSMNCWFFFAQYGMITMFWCYLCISFLPRVRRVVSQYVHLQWGSAYKTEEDHKYRVVLYKFDLQMRIISARWHAVHAWRIVADIIVILAAVDAWWQYYETDDRALPEAVKSAEEDFSILFRVQTLI